VKSVKNNRLNFYNSVITLAKEVCCRSIIPSTLSDLLILKEINNPCNKPVLNDLCDKPVPAKLVEALTELQKALNIDSKPTAHSIHIKQTRLVDIFIMFDKAQTLV
jgi:hypothetical protein